MPTGIYPRTDEMKRKISQGLRENPTVMLGISSMGRIPWNKGKRGCYTEEQLKRMSESRIGKYRGKESWHWKNGRHITNHGYVRLTVRGHDCSDKKGYVLEHRYVVEKYIGRCLLKTECVHHINKIRKDNRPSNLMVFNSADAHNKFEKGILIKKSSIVFDGRKFKKMPTGYKRTGEKPCH